MTRESFNSLVARLERSWSDRPQELLKQTVEWLILGYAVLLTVLLCCGVMVLIGLRLSLKYQGTAGTLSAAAVAFAGLLTAFLILRCLWVRFEPPKGIVLEEEEHPDLHALIHGADGLASGVSLHQVLLNPEMNASVVQNPRLGIFGWYRTYLVIGLPLMETLAVDEFRAVLAHEFAHVRSPEGRSWAWLHRTRTTWEGIVGHLATGPFRPVMARFFRGFWPHFNSRASILSRFNELAADQVAAGVVSPEALASGLRRLAVQSPRLEEEFWPPLETGIPGTAPLPGDVMERMSVFLGTEPDPASARRWLALTLGKATGSIDTHPGLAERLSRLGNSGTTVDAALPEKSSAAEVLLRPEFLARARMILSREWLHEAMKSRSRGEPSSPGAETDTRSVKEAWNRIAALSRLDGLEKIQPEVLTLLERQPSHSGALYLRGCHLAEKGDPCSASYLEQAAADPTLSARAYETLVRYHSRFGNQQDTLALKERAERHHLELRAALVERDRVCGTDCFLPHDLSARELESLRATLECEPAVRKAWVGSKEVRHFPCWRHLVLVVDVRWPAFRPISERMLQQLLARIVERWEADGYVHPLRLDEKTRPVLRAIRRGVADSKVYRRK